jgi:C4-dicarboxylate-specific signal transduction histidine kinase
MGNEELDMRSAQNSLTQRQERPESCSLRKVTGLGRMTEPIAKELNECLCAIVVNASTCLRMLAADRPNVEEARETARRTIRDSNRAAEAVSRLRALFTEKK